MAKADGPRFRIAAEITATMLHDLMQRYESHPAFRLLDVHALGAGTSMSGKPMSARAFVLAYLLKHKRFTTKKAQAEAAPLGVSNGAIGQQCVLMTQAKLLKRTGVGEYERTALGVKAAKERETPAPAPIKKKSNGAVVIPE